MVTAENIADSGQLKLASVCVSFTIARFRWKCVSYADGCDRSQRILNFLNWLFYRWKISPFSTFEPTATSFIYIFSVEIVACAFQTSISPLSFGILVIFSLSAVFAIKDWFSTAKRNSMSWSAWQCIRVFVLNYLCHHLEKYCYRLLPSQALINFHMRVCQINTSDREFE